MKKIFICMLMLVVLFTASCDISDALEEFSSNMMKTVTDAAGDYLRETEVPSSSKESSLTEDESSSEIIEE